MPRFAWPVRENPRSIVGVTQPRRHPLPTASFEQTPDSGVRVRVREPRQQVVVRAGSAPITFARSHVALTRSDTPTLIGLDVRERQDTLPDAELDDESPGWVSISNDWDDDQKTLLALKRRPIVLREGRDDALVEHYRCEVERILASGIFERRR